ncbi:hypothetical protein [Embleya hyalina]|uniref:Restriction endonuclease type IV Mrr domain-containing protein n=1 Tax=Embleya hyalina TaxID=516124 RepID=A0A401YYD6_9ACTN|nr:hypothetical protein [Embleya hyalina]GCD99656.1 hypothetical protein EHYA_07378 [Embleya hyalina]
MSGEAMHQKGADGTRRAKLWLDATTRVSASWTNEDAVHAARLEFTWPHGEKRPFSFDVGGILSGDEFHGQFFVAECKKYAGASDQGVHFDDWVAKCYLTRRDNHRLADHFMWITWHPFRSSTWTDLCTPESVIKGLLLERNIDRVFGTTDRAEADAMIDRDLARDVADRMWVIVLSDKQERLVISPRNRALVFAQQLERGEL